MACRAKRTVDLLTLVDTILSLCKRRHRRGHFSPSVCKIIPVRYVDRGRSNQLVYCTAAATSVGGGEGGKVWALDGQVKEAAQPITVLHFPNPSPLYLCTDFACYRLWHLPNTIKVSLLVVKAGVGKIFPTGYHIQHLHTGLGWKVMVFISGFQYTWQ